MSQEGVSTRQLDVHFVGGLAWTAGAKGITQAFSWASLLITARLLSPADFGLVEMAGIFLAATNLLAEFGVGTAVTQMRELNHRVLAQIQTVSCVVCSLFYLASIALAPYIAQFFHSPQLVPLLLVNNLTFFLTGFQSIPFGLMQRDLDYRKLSICEATGALTQSVTTAAFAWFGFRYWSLALGVVCAKTASTAMMLYFKPVAFARPHWDEIHEALRFGGQLAVGRLATVAYSLSDGVVVGRLFGDSVLGLYRMSMNLATTPAEKISALIMRVTIPLFARVQSDQELVHRYLLILIEMLTMIETPLMLGLGIVAPEAVQLILGPKWAGAVGPLRWLVVFMTIRTLGTLMEQVLVSQRASRFTMSMSLLNLIVMPVAFWVGGVWKGTNGVAASWIVLAPITVLPVVVKVLRTTTVSLREQVVAALPAITGVSSMVAVLLLLRGWATFQSWSVVVRLMVQIAVGGLTYGGILWTFFPSRVLRYVRFAKELRARKAGLAGEAGTPDSVSVVQNNPL